MILKKKIKMIHAFGDKKLWILDGRGKPLQNILDLKCALEEMSDEIFISHLEGDNDFSNWVFYVLKDKVLAKKLEKVRERQRALEIVRKRVRDYEMEKTSHETIQEIKTSKKKHIGLKQLSKQLLDSADLKRINKIKDIGERTEALKYSVYCKLHLKYNDILSFLEKSEHEDKMFMEMMLEMIPQKMRLLKEGYEEELSGIFSILHKIEVELGNV